MIEINQPALKGAAKYRAEFRKKETEREEGLINELIAGYPKDILGSYLVPLGGQPLHRRLIWTVLDQPQRADLAKQKKIEATDRIRGRLIPGFQRHDISIYDQIRIIHNAHMGNAEHLLLYPSQAKTLLISGESTVPSLGGLIRSENDLRRNIGLGGGIARCARFQDTSALLKKATQKAEELFPKGDTNPKVDAFSIYYHLSAFQLAIALIHPFFEACGRTSEDAMYALWQRRPDLSDTVRFVSSNGSRHGYDVIERGNLINVFALDIVHTIGRNRFRLTDDELEKIESYDALVKAAKEKLQVMEVNIELDYLKGYTLILEELIESIGDTDKLKKDLAVVALARNLQDSSPIYQMQDGSILIVI